MSTIKYTEQLYARISLCLGCTFIVFGLFCFIGMLKPASHSIIQSQTSLGIVFSALGIFFFLAQAVFTILASAKKKSYHKLLANGMKVNGIVEKVSMQRYIQYGNKFPYRIFYRYTYQGNVYHHKSHLLWDKPRRKEGDSIEVYINHSEKSAVP